MPIRRLASASVLFLIAATRFAPALTAQVVTSPPDTAALLQAAFDTVPAADSRPDSVRIATWLDAWLEARMDADDITGATVAVVRDGALLFAKGYGWADAEAHTPVVADRTLFRIGSISKLFVWTSVMQLVEQGRIELDADVNTYLDTVEVPAAFDRPITLADLMTHSAGFEDHVVGLFASDTAALRPSADILTEQMPQRVRPPGDVTSYSNHGTALAMQVVEDVSGMPWMQYIERNILQPLRMSHTTFRQPLPAALADDMSEGYASGGGEAEDFELVPLGAVGAASATATDMARFMIAHLQLGAYDGARILEEETAREMQRELFRNAPGVNPFLHGFADLSTHGLHMLGHGGDTFWFHSQLSLLPEHDLGIFVSYNTAGSGPQALVSDFVRWYFDVEDAGRLTPPADFGERVGRFTGRFRANRFAHDDLTKVMAALGTMKVERSGDTALAIDLGDDKVWIETAPLTFRAAWSDRTLAFRENQDGRITHMFVGDVPYVSFERVPWSESPGVQLPILVFALVMMALTVVALPVTAFYRYRHGYEPADPVPGIGRFFGWMASALFLVFAVGLAVLASGNAIPLGEVGGIRRLLWLPVGGVVFAGFTVVFAVIAWGGGRGTRAARIAFTLLALALVLHVWQLNVWNLLGWNLG
ncbi:MAG: beta-lactamase family protein [Gemmatimonadetes bacterium]|nr:beta-lactamase family protein [Gemmatimonadota bacterium]